MKIRHAPAIVAVLLIVVLCVVFLIVKPALEPTFAERICNNLVRAGYITRDHCVISDHAPDVMDTMFPEGTSMDYVITGMQGFEKETESSGRDASCKKWNSIRYIINYKWFPLGLNEYYEFIFCDDILIKKVWGD